MVDAKEIAVKASVDVGDNIASLVEKLATHIGTTADKIFPLYVKQQVVSGWGRLALCAFTTALGLIIISASWKKADWADGNPASIMVAVGAIILAISFVSVIAVGRQQYQRL